MPGLDRMCQAITQNEEALVCMRETKHPSSLSGRLLREDGLGNAAEEHLLELPLDACLVDKYLLLTLTWCTMPGPPPAAARGAEAAGAVARGAARSTVAAALGAAASNSAVA